MYKYKWYILYNYNSCISVQKITGALASLCKKITYKQHEDTIYISNKTEVASMDK